MTGEASPTPLVAIDRPRPEIIRLELRRPERLNALSSELIVAVHAALDDAASDAACRVIVLTGGGRGFCAGMDLRDFGQPPGPLGRDEIQRTLAVQRQIASLIPHLRAVPQPIIAAVNGPATGAGMALVLGSDIRIAANSARFSAAYIRIGLSSCDNGVSWLLPRLVGAGRAHEVMLTGRLFDADEALRIGLVTDVVPDDELSDVALAKAEEIAANSAFAVALTKEGMWAALETPGLHAAMVMEDRQQALGLFSADHRAAVRDFLARRRSPESTGRPT
jgi:enoyl-CoA hydratase/carnithine racemase